VRTTPLKIKSHSHVFAHFNMRELVDQLEGT
jgi:hypothetical protein